MAIAEINPLALIAPAEGWLGPMSGTATIVGDLVLPVANDDWEALGS